MSDSTIKYDKIDSRSLSDALTTGRNTSNAQNNLTNNQGKLWSTLLGSLENPIDWKQLEGLEDQKLIRKELQKELKKMIVDSGIELEKNAKGGVAWSKDKQTRPIMKYTSDIAKIISNGLIDILLPGDGTVASRCDILKACKGKETIEQMLARVHKMIDTHANNGVNGDATKIISSCFEYISVGMSVATPAEYDGIYAIFNTLGIHIKTIKGA